MGLKNLTLKDAGLLDRTFGGSTITLIEDGVVVPGGLHFITAETDDSAPGVPKYTVTVRNRPAVLNPKTGLFGKAKRSISVSRPVQLSHGGSVVFNTVRFEMEMHPEFDEGKMTSLRDFALQFVALADVDAYWKYGSLS